MATVFSHVALLLAISILLLHINLVVGRHGGHVTHSSSSVPLHSTAGSHDRHQPNDELYEQGRKGKPVPLQIAGSRLPDCSHACGSCSPCRLVMVSFVCASLQEAETCPMAYKCMCNSKSYPVP